MKINHWKENLTGWSSNNPVGTILLASLAVTLVTFGTSSWLPLLGYTIIFIMVADRSVKLAKKYSSNQSTEDSTQPSELDPLSELRERYARGQIGDDEFEHRLEQLLRTETLEQARKYPDRERAVEEV